MEKDFEDDLGKKPGRLKKNSKNMKSKKARRQKLSDKKE